jgi:hypothetical protein
MVGYDSAMLPRTSGLLLLCTALAATSAGFLCHAQPAQSAATVRYQFCDHPDGKVGWANPSFDDSDWPIAQPSVAFSKVAIILWPY